MVENYVSAGAMSHPLTSYPSHEHGYWEICLYTYGRGTATVGGKTIDFESGTIICIPPHVQHEEVARKGFQNKWVAVENLETSTDIPVIRESTDHPVFSIASIIVIERYMKKPASEVIIGNLFGAFMAYLNQWQVADPHDPVVSKVQRRIIANLRNPHFSVADAFKGVHLSPDHIRRLFTSHIGKPPVKYLIELRMNRARELLQLGTPIKDVASKVGLPDPYYFSRLFRKACGVSPSAYKLSIGRS